MLDVKTPVALTNACAHLEQSENLTEKDASNLWSVDKIRIVHNRPFAVVKRVSRNVKMSALDILADRMLIVCRPITKRLVFVVKDIKAIQLTSLSDASVNQSAVEHNPTARPTLSATAEFASRPVRPTLNVKTAKLAFVDNASIHANWTVRAE